MNIMDQINSVINEIWLEQIPIDYANDVLLLEDALKCSLYYHLRTRLGDNWLKYHRIRIYTEYWLGEKLRADIAIVRLLPKSKREGIHLRDGVEEVLAIIEAKYKNKGSNRPFNDDMGKLIGYVQEYAGCHLFAAFIHEKYYPVDTESITSMSHPSNIHVTELMGYWDEQSQGMTFKIKQ